MSLQLKIVSPEKIIYDGMATSVTVPGVTGEFQILTNHAPLISCLGAGKVTYVNENGNQEFVVTSGFVEINKNNVSLCVEL